MKPKLLLCCQTQDCIVLSTAYQDSLALSSSLIFIMKRWKFGMLSEFTFGDVLRLISYFGNLKIKPKNVISVSLFRWQAWRSRRSTIGRTPTWLSLALMWKSKWNWSPLRANLPGITQVFIDDSSNSVGVSGNEEFISLLFNYRWSSPNNMSPHSQSWPLRT